MGYDMYILIYTICIIEGKKQLMDKYKDFPEQPRVMTNSEGTEYFERMLCGGFAEAGSSAAGSAAQIPIQNTTPAAFRALLRYLYTDELAFSEDDVRACAHHGAQRWT